MITIDIRRWDVRHLVGASALYWAGRAEHGENRV
jgi:hypothetical protein